MNVYRFANYDIIAPYLVEQTDNRHQPDTRQSGNGQQADTSQTEARHSKKKEIKNKIKKKDLEGEGSLVPLNI
jgi:hypothetical protein